ncbi:MAG TPA: DUF2007 domain-containing protein [Verrucomicrobiae bacterium]
MSLVKVYMTFSSADAQLVWSRLDAAGFHATVFHEGAAMALDGYALAAGGIQVKVPESEAEEARAFLDAPVSELPGDDDSAAS